MEIADIKTRGAVKCAFCKNWYDPTNSAIKPRSSALWEYDLENAVDVWKEILKPLGIMVAVSLL